MTLKAGLWIDHQQAIVVLMKDSDIDLKKFHVGASEAGAAPVGGRHEHDYSRNDFVADDKRQRKLEALHNAMYEEVFACVRDAELLLILGPGEAKLEFNKLVQGHAFRGLVEAVETADKMTERQLIARVSEHFASAVP